MVLQETIKWITKDDLNWPGASILNMEAIQQTKGRGGGLTVIVSPDIEFTELHRDVIGIDFDKLKGSTLPPEHVEVVNLFNYEEALPNSEMNINQSVMADATSYMTPQLTETQTHTNVHRPAHIQASRGEGEDTPNKATDGHRKNKSNNNKEAVAPAKRKRKKGEQGPPKNQDFIQAITIQLTNGLTITGSYLGHSNRADTVSKFMT